MFIILAIVTIIVTIKLIVMLIDINKRKVVLENEYEEYHFIDDDGDVIDPVVYEFTEEDMLEEMRQQLRY